MENNDLFQKNNFKKFSVLQKIALYLFIALVVVYLILSFKFILS
jgi:hypothetical protein